MKIKRISGHAGAMALAGGLAFQAEAGTFKHITIDGSFDDWSGVPVAHAQPRGQESTNGISYQNIWLANDDDYLYLRFTILPPATNPFTVLQNLYVNTDNRSTGYGPTSYDSFGSEMLVQAGIGYRQKDGAFNEGGIKGLDWAAAPATGTNFEARISRRATYTNGAPVFIQNTIAVALESENADYTPASYAPPNCCGLVYTFATNNAAAGTRGSPAK